MRREPAKVAIHRTEVAKLRRSLDALSHATPMHTASLSSKGQIVIPKALRSELNLVPGTRFALSLEAGRLVLEPLREPEFDLDAIHAAVDALAGCLGRNSP